MGTNLKNRNFYIRLLFMILIPITSSVYGFLNKPRADVHIMSNKLDNLIPFKSIFIIPYLYWFVFVNLILIYLAYSNGLVFFKLLASLIIGMLLCDFIFFVYPTYVPRPILTGDDLLTNLVRYIYNTDQPYNCFPSIHVLNSVLATAFHVKYGKQRIIKFINIVSCILICLSTVFIKQHYVPDIISGTIIAFVVFIVNDRKVFHNKVVISKLPFLG